VIFVGLCQIFEKNEKTINDNVITMNNNTKAMKMKITIDIINKD